MNAITYSGWSLLYESISGGYSSPSTLNSSLYYVWGKDLSGTLDGAGGVGGLLATEVGGVWYFPLYDNNGNVTDYVSETGDVVASYSYDAFGRTIAQSGSMFDVFPIFGQYKASRTLNMISMRNRLREISEMYYNRGFSIESLDYWIENDSNSIKYKDNNSRKWPTFGFILGGHGWAGSIEVTHSTGDSYESIGISKTKRGYALGMLYVFGCYAGAGDWKSQAAPNASIFVSPSWRPTVRLEMPTPRFPSK